MSDVEWKLVHSVHLEGSFAVTKAAWEYFIRQGFGRIIMTISAAGLYGNIGQSNYASGKYQYVMVAKMGLFGLGKALSIEGAKRNITCNIIAPVAGTRITETVLPDDLVKLLNPAYVAPFVCSLCHESCPLNGEVFEVGAGHVSLVRLQTSSGELLGDKTPTELVKNAIEFKNETFVGNAFELMKDVYVSAKRVLPSSLYVKDLQGRVAIVTGAAQGLGFEYAKELAKFGCNLVLVDLAVDSKGTSLVENAKQNLMKSGVRILGIAKSVANSSEIVDIAIKEFGRVDILVNNAGILRDKSFGNLSPTDWSAVLQVHLEGTYSMIRACLPHFSKQKFGKIINVSSPSCLSGNYGQANYCSAKAAIWGLTTTLSKEFKKLGIDVGCIAPLALTSMTKGLFDKKQTEYFSSDMVAPFVAAICSYDVKMNGSLFIIGGGMIRCIKMARSSLERVPENLSSTKFKTLMEKLVSSKFTRPTDAQSAFTSFIEVLNSEPMQEKLKTELTLPPEFVDADKIITYHLSIGFSENDFDYVYENSSGFRPFITYSNIFIYKLLSSLNFDAYLDNFEWVNLLHLSQETQQFLDVPNKCSIYSKAKIDSCIKTTKGSILKLNIDSFLDEKHTKLAFRNIGIVFVKKSVPKREFGDKAALGLSKVNLSDGDNSCSATIPKTQAALFRLSGDKNPLHMYSTHISSNVL